MADDVKLPTEEEIAKLPRWARVALAARCARRVLPVFRQLLPDRTWERGGAILCQATVFSEQVAGEGMVDVAAAEFIANKANHYINAPADGLDASYEHQRADSAGLYNDAATAGRVAGAVYCATRATAGGSDLAFHAVSYAAGVADIRVYIRRDFDRLARLAAEQNWTDNTPVPPTVFGPLWPDGPPPGWPTESDDNIRGLILELYSRPGTPPEVIGDGLVKLWEAANEYHMARGGGVLTFDDFKQLVGALVPVSSGPPASGG